jgi:type I restriction enzyme M protein
MIPKSEFDRLTAKYPLNFEDVVYVSRGSYRIGDVGIVGPDDESVALTREIHVLRVLKDNHSGLSPYYLLYLLSSSAVAQQTKARVFLDTTMPNISDRYLDIKLPWDIDSVRRAEISKRVESALKDKWSAMANVRKLLSEIRPRLDQESEVDDLVEGGDDSLGL